MVLLQQCKRQQAVMTDHGECFNTLATQHRHLSSHRRSLWSRETVPWNASTLFNTLPNVEVEVIRNAPDHAVSVILDHRRNTLSLYHAMAETVLIFSWKLEEFFDHNPTHGPIRKLRDCIHVWTVDSERDDEAVVTLTFSPYDEIPWELYDLHRAWKLDIWPIRG